jgi:hypothetical protein
MSLRLGLVTLPLALSAACGDSLPTPPITGLEVSPLALTPAFSPDIHDYTVRCAEGDNPVTVRVTDAHGTTSRSVVLAEDQLLDIDEQAWIRCLPHDFPAITVTPHPENGAPTPGWYLVDNKPFAIVLDTNGTPVWYRRGADIAAVDSPVPGTISFMPSSTGTANVGFEQLDLASGSAQYVRAVGVPTDLHELQLLSNGDYMVLAYETLTGVDLTGLGTFGDDANILDCEIQEVDPSGALVWSWRASDHVDAVRESLTQMVNNPGTMPVIDVFHCNAIDEGPSGDLLLSLRHTSAIYDIDRATGAVRWKLGGTAFASDGAQVISVVNDPETTFSRQHDARFVDATHLTLFDDHGGGTPGVARGLEYELDFTSHQARLVWQFLGLEQSQYTGSFRRFPDRHGVIGWGFPVVDPRVLTEVDGDGSDVLDIALATHAYRAIKVSPDQLDIEQMRATAGGK